MARALILTLAIALGALGLDVTAHATVPKCFGAAARDATRSCVNRALRLSVSPSPRAAQLQPSSPCTPLRSSEPPALCTFGAPTATTTVALVGDSHSVHWRAALDVVARTKGWRGVSMYQSRCPYTTASTALAEPLGSQCTQWKRDVVQWFQRHPEVSTMFVSHNATAAVTVAQGQTTFDAKVVGYQTAWDALPPSVKHIVVIRDVPHNGTRTLACVERALSRHREPGPACAIALERSLLPDPAVTATARVTTPRVQAIDLSRFMCDSRRCYPVVGGVLVHKDVGHLTRTFATTLGPFLLRDVDGLMAAW